MSPLQPPLVDRFGRVARDLRVSLTDRCSLRCSYCMPAEGLPWLAAPTLLTDAELIRLTQLFVSLGVNSLRLTGGEPLVRRGLPDVVAALAGLPDRPTLALTTNGVGLDKLAGALATAGLDRINVSLDTLSPATFAQLTRRDRHGDVLAGLAAVKATGITPVKVNAVLMRGVNDHEAPDLLGWALREGFELRFIEHMPLDAQHGWDRTTMMTADEIAQTLESHFELAPTTGRGSAPAELFDVVAGPGMDRWAPGPHRVGIIASVTRPFCRDCDRLRLTADGQLLTCLFATAETDLRTPMRAGATDAELAELIRTAVLGKQAGHGIDAPGFLQPQRPMSAIGG